MNQPAPLPSLPSAPELRLAEKRRLEQHLCLACSHHVVCRVARAADPNLAIVISQCLAFEPADRQSTRRGPQ